MKKDVEEPALDRRAQILEAAMSCFARRGFHQTTMQDISAAAEISVGLIYRYFASKEKMISAIAAEHKKTIAAVLAKAAEAPTLLEAMEIFFTSHCAQREPHILAGFVLELFAEATRNPRVAKIVRDVAEAKLAGLAGLIARAPEFSRTPNSLSPRLIAEMIFAVIDGTLMRCVLRPAGKSTAAQRQDQLHVARSLWRLLFTSKSHGNSHR